MRQRSSRPSSARRMASEHVSSPVEHPAFQIRTKGYVRSSGTTFCRKATKNDGSRNIDVTLIDRSSSRCSMACGSWSSRSVQARDGREALEVRPAPQPALERRPRVAAEVEAVVAPDRLEEQVDLELLALGLAGPRSRRTSAIPHRWGHS